MSKTSTKYRMKKMTKTNLANKLFSLSLILIMIIISLPRTALAQFFDESEQQKISGIPNATIKLPNTEYTESTVDLKVKVLGGEVNINRTWVNGRWYVNPTWANLRFVTDPLDDNVKTIDRAGTLYQRTGDVNLYSFNQVYIKKTDTGWYWYDRQGNWINYDKAGRVLEYGDRNNIKVSFVLDTEGRRIAIKDNNDEVVYNFSYDDQEHLTKVIDREGRTVSYNWTDDRLTKVIDVLGNEWLYGYDTNGQLAQKTEPDGGIIKIAYTDSVTAPKSAMTSGKDAKQPSQNTVVSTNSADKDTKIARVGKVTDKTGAVIIYNTQYNRTNKQYSISIDDPLGKKTQLVFDANGKRLSTTINDILKESLKRDNTNKLLKVIDERGLTTTVQFDDTNKTSKITRPDGLSESFQYDDTYGVLTNYTNAQGTVTNLQYDAKGNLIKSTEAVGKVEQRTANWAYDGYGQPITVTLGEGDKAITLHQSYDKYGNITSFTDGNGNTYQFTYDIQGQITSVKNPLNNTWTISYNLAGFPIETTDPLNHTVKYTSDFSGRITEVINPLGYKTSYNYQFDNNGWQIKQTDALNQTLTYYYDLLGKPVKVVSPSGLEEKQTYDSEGRTKKQQDPTGNILSLEYGQKDSGLEGLVVKALYPTFSESYKYNSLGLPTVVSQMLDINNSLTTNISYNELGLPTSITRPNNSISLIEYNAFGNITKLVDPLAGETTQTWDNVGNVTTLTDAKGNTYHFSYDKNANLIKETRALGNEVQYTYDAANQLIAQKDANDTTIQYEYDQAGRLIKTSYTVKDATTPAQIVNYSYNEADQLIAVNQSGENNSSFEYLLDELGRRIKETINYNTANNQITKELQYSYDVDGNLATMTYPDNSKVAYSYEQGQIKEVLLANGEKITWNNYTWQVPTQINFPGSSQAIIYDPLQRPLSIKVTDANNNLLINRSYSYDKVGNITQQGSEDGLTNYQYDLLDRLTTVIPSKTLQQKGLPIEGYSYDAIDNRIGSVHQAGNWLYNDNNQLIQWSNSNNLTTLNYSANGHLTKETSSGKEFTYSYDATDRLVSIKEGDREVASYQYDPFGRRISKSVNGVTTYFIYTDEGLLAELDERGNIQLAYGWQPSTLWGTSPLWQANISGNQTLQTASYNYLITDYLGTPQLAVNSRGQQTWKGVSEAFGKTQLDITNQITMNLRFPGQYYDEEIGFHYNYLRYYNPNIGRYIQGDPIGLLGGSNTYSYVYQNPLIYKDPNGELAWFIAPLLGAAISGLIDLGTQYFLHNGKWECISFSEVIIAATVGGVASSLGPSGVIFGRNGSTAAQYGFKGGIFNRGDFRVGWSRHNMRNNFSIHGGIPHTPSHWHKDLFSLPDGTLIPQFGVGGGMTGGIIVGGVGAILDKDCSCR